MARGQSQGEGGYPPVRQHALPAHGMPEQEGGTPPSQANEQADKGAGDGPSAPTARGPSLEEGGDPSARQRALLAHGMPEQEGGIPRS